MASQTSNLPTATDAIEQNFIDALKRLMTNKPKNKELLALSRSGTLNVTVTTVAKEAGHSRTLIGHKTCKYPNVRDFIVSLRNDPENPTRMQDVVRRKQQDAARLRRELQVSQTVAATLLARVQRLQEEVGRLKRLNDRQRNPVATVLKLPEKR